MSPASAWEIIAVKTTPIFLLLSIMAIPQATRLISEPGGGKAESEIGATADEKNRQARLRVRDEMNAGKQQSVCIAQRGLICSPSHHKMISISRAVGMFVTIADVEVDEI